MKNVSLVKSSAISEIKEEILKEKEKIEEEKKEMTKIESSISENDLHGTVKNLPNVKNLDPKDFVVYEKLDQDFRNHVLLTRNIYRILKKYYTNTRLLLKHKMKKFFEGRN